MELRRAAPVDAEAIAAVFIPSFESLDFLPRLHTHDESRAFVARIVDEQDVWVAVSDGLIVGFAALSAEMIDQLYVHPDAQRRGVGAALLGKAKEERPDGFIFWVFQQNEGARRFYEAHGCRVIRLTDGEGNEEKTPDVLYAWEPGPA